MSRLTERNESGGISVADLPAALAKLAELEDAAQDGRLAILPSESGQVIFANKRLVYVVNCVDREDWETAFNRNGK
ncbi:MAG: hypothetical protein IKR84_01410 [Oscillibacter sp.]|nr:hypothetical protein [Oscillibacter sp.]